MLKRRSLLALLVSITLSSPLLPVQAAPRAATLDPGVKSLFNRARAVMGTDLQRQPKFLHSTAEMRVLGLVGEVDMRKNGRNLRIDTTIGPTRELVVFRGDQIYERGADGLVRHMADTDVMRTLTMASFSNYPALLHPEYGHALAFAPRGGSNEADLRWVQVLAPHSPLQYYGFNTKTGYLREIIIDHAPTLLRIHLHDWRSINRQQIPFRFELADDQHDILEARLTRVDLDAKGDANDFAAPKALRVHVTRPTVVALIPEADNRFFLPLNVNGHDYSFHLDSSSRTTIIDDRVAAQLHLTVDRPQSGALAARGVRSGFATLPGFAVNGALFPSQRVIVANLGRTVAGKPIDGIMGFALFAQAALVLDPQKNTLTIAEPGTQLAGQHMPATFQRGFIDLIGGLIDGPGNAHFVIATGRGNGLEFNRSFYDANLAILEKSSGHTLVKGGQPALTATLKGLNLNGFPPIIDLPVLMRFADSPYSADAHIAGSIGMNFLQSYRLGVDVQNNVLRLEQIPGVVPVPPAYLINALTTSTKNGQAPAGARSADGQTQPPAPIGNDANSVLNAIGSPAPNPSSIESPPPERHHHRRHESVDSPLSPTPAPAADAQASAAPSPESATTAPSPESASTAIPSPTILTPVASPTPSATDVPSPSVAETLAPTPITTALPQTPETPAAPADGAIPPLPLEPSAASPMPTPFELPTPAVPPTPAPSATPAPSKTPGPVAAPKASATPGSHRQTQAAHGARSTPHHSPASNAKTKKRVGKVVKSTVKRAAAPKARPQVLHKTSANAAPVTVTDEARLRWAQKHRGEWAAARAKWHAMHPGLRNTSSTKADTSHA